MGLRLTLSVLGLVVAAILVAAVLRGPAAPGPAMEVQTPLADTQSPTAVLPGPDMKSWVKEQAQQMDLPNRDSEAKQKRLVTTAQNLTEPQRRQLLHLARDPQTSTPEKVLSTYMLVEAGPRALRELRELIASPVKAEDAASIQRDKTLRIMALDGLSSRALKDPSAQEALVRAVDEIEDPFVRSYARQKMEQVQTQ